MVIHKYLTIFLAILSSSNALKVSPLFTFHHRPISTKLAASRTNQHHRRHSVVLPRRTSKMLPFRITNGYESKYADQVIQESEEVPFPFFKGANKTEASATTNCFGGWQTYPNFVKWLLKNDPDHAKERLNAFLQARGTSLLKLDGENGSIRWFPATSQFEYWTRNIRRPGKFHHPKLEQFVVHLHRVTEGKINVLYFEEYSLATTTPCHVLIGAGRTTEDEHAVGLMTAPLHELLHDEMVTCFGEANAPFASLEEFHDYAAEKHQGGPSLFLVPAVSGGSDRSLPVHQLLQRHAELARIALAKQEALVQAGGNMLSIRSQSKFEGMVMTLRSAHGDFMIKDKFGVHCETSYPPLEELLPLLDEKFHDLFKELIELNQWSERIVIQATENKKASDSAEKEKGKDKASFKTSIDPALLLGRIEMAVESAAAKNLVGADFNDAVMKDVLDSHPGLDRNKVIGLMKKNKWFQS
jgi:hypothetical protein